MSDMRVRLGIESDIDTVMGLSKSLCEYDRDNFDSSLKCDWLDSEYGKEFLSSLIKEEDCCMFIAEDENSEIVGYLFGEISEKLPWRNIKKQSELIEIFVKESCRGMKVGNKLFEAFKNWSQDRGVKNIKVLVSYENEKGINFYKKNGFESYDLTLEYNL